LTWATRSKPGTRPWTGPATKPGLKTLVYTINEIPEKAFMGRLTKEEMYQSGKIELVPIVSKNNYLYLIMPARLQDYFDFVMF
jgi:hypothetical protein